MTSHDQNFKNLFIDYPLQALRFFAPSEARHIDATATITPVRQEQLQDKLGERYHELDCPLLVDWPDQRREALLFVLEEETEPQRFSIHRLARYCLHLAEMFETDRVVPVVVFLRRGRYATELNLGSEQKTYLNFETVICDLSRLPCQEYLHTDNIPACVNLPNMADAGADKLAVYAHATQRLRKLEPDLRKLAKYLDFIDIYSALTEQERYEYTQRYPQEAKYMSAFAERFRQKGHQEGLQKGLKKGRQESLYQVALNMLDKGSELSFVQEVTGLSASDMQQLRINP